MRAATAVLASLLLVAPAHAHPDDPFHEGREAAERLTFSAVALVQWADETGEHEATVEVEAQRGEVRIDGPREVVAHAQTWTRLWSGAAPPPVELKYDLLRAGETVVAGRLAQTMEVWVGGALRERVALDQATGLVLHREQLGADGRPERVVTVQRLDLLPAPPPAPGGARRPTLARPVRSDSLPRMYRTPVALDGGYRRVGAYRDGDGVHVLYSDGLHGISVFAQPGRLPEGGRPVKVGRWAGRQFAWPGGEAVAWEADGMVYTLVGDGPGEELTAAATSLPGPPRLSVVGRVKRSARAMAELLSG